MSYSDGYGSQRIDYDLHGLVGIRLLNASATDAAVVTRQLGLIHTPLTREPDIIIRFVDRVPTSSRLHYLGLDEAGFTEDAFLVLRSRHGARVRAQIPFEQIGKRCEITCQTGGPEVPLLIPIINLTALSKGAFPLHASAFTYNGTGVLTTGWSKGGKTETLLAFMAKGAEYVADEWVHLSSDGRHMYGIPEPIRMWDWHLRELPQYRSMVGWSERMRLWLIKLVQLLGRVLSRAVPHKFFPADMIPRTIPLLKRQLYVDLPPQKLFGHKFGKRAGNVEKVFFVASHGTSDVTVRRMDSQDIARRMAFSVQYELLNFMEYYLMFRFAFPQVRSEFIEQAGELWSEGLARVLRDKESYVVYHPYPVPIPVLFDAINPFITRSTRS
jgi:hypothetical protein